MKTKRQYRYCEFLLLLNTDFYCASVDVVYEAQLDIVEDIDACLMGGEL